MNKHYDKDYIHTKDFDRFLEYKPDLKQQIFTGDKLQVIIPQRYEAYGHLEIGETVITIGVCDLLIDDTYQATLNMLTKIEIAHSEISKKTIEGQVYFVLTLYKGDRFICNTEVIKDSSVLFTIYSEMVTKGHMIYNMNYDQVAYLLDKSKELCDTSLRVDHVILEIIYSHIARDTNNLAIQYRHTDMKDDLKFIGLRTISYSPTSTTARLLGSYWNEALNSSVLTEVKNSSILEDLLR